MRAPRERWREAYRDAPHIVDAFARAEARDGAIASALGALLPGSPSRLLEVGAGSGLFAALFAPRAARYVAVEPEEALLALAHQRLRDCENARIVRARAEALPFPDGSVDAVIALWVLAHLAPRTRELALREARRVMHPQSAGLFVVESGVVSEFQTLRRFSGADPARELAPLLAAGGEIVARVASRLTFESADEARDVVGYLCGEPVRAALTRAPSAVIGHEAAIVRFRPC